MLDGPSRSGNYVYAASAPATMLWGPVGHKPGMAGMGGRTPSKTLLEALAGESQAPRQAGPFVQPGLGKLAETTTMGFEPPPPQ